MICCCYPKVGEFQEVDTDKLGWFVLCPEHGKKYQWGFGFGYQYREPMKSAFEDQEGGSHYKSFAIQPLEFITKNALSWFPGSITKYACRADKKGGSTDIKKIIHYGRLWLEQVYGIKSEIVYSDEEKETRKTTTP